MVGVECSVTCQYTHTQLYRYVYIYIYIYTLITITHVISTITQQWPGCEQWIDSLRVVHWALLNFL